jgi:hypothetical protein
MVLLLRGTLLWSKSGLPTLTWLLVSNRQWHHHSPMTSALTYDNAVEVVAASYHQVFVKDGAVGRMYCPMQPTKPMNGLECDSYRDAHNKSSDFLS